MKKQLWAIFILAGFSRGADWYVAPAGSSSPDGSREHPFAFIQQALDTAQSGDRIILQPGIYSGPGNANLNPQGKILTIQSIDPENLDVVVSTIIDPNGLERGFVFNHNETPQFILQGFTLRNARCRQEDEFPHGAGIFCSESSPTIRFCIFENCAAEDGWGGAFYGEFCNTAFTHCLLACNKGRYGGAIAANLESAISLNHCTVSGNKALFAGGAIVCDFESSISLRNSILFFNEIEFPNGQGFQIELRSSSLSISYSNIADGPGDIRADRESFLAYGKGILHLDPYFVFFEPGAPFEQLNFRLKSRWGRWNPLTRSWVRDFSTSPCIDAGDPNEIWLNEPWPNGKRVNLGFYGGTNQASLSGNPADFNIDGIVNLSDLSELLELWLNDSLSGIYDLSQDGRIDLEDFEQFTGHWFQKSKSIADFDEDGDVDLNDLSAFSEYWLQTGTVGQDLNQDGIVDLQDLALFTYEWLWEI
ncbi:MAG TPA: hypothetical protein PKY88_03860 [Anaerohalosphaeraceae bacterium]|nr:hypothetical protein [Anaerohalosphaeraceae bacterium]